MAVMQYPIAENLVDATLTATGHVDWTLKPCDSLSIMLSVGTVSGSTPTMDVAVQTSPDGGTTYLTVQRFTQVTTTGAAETITFKPYLGVGDAATAIVSAATGGQLKGNVVCAKDMRILYTIAGTTPSLAAKVFVVYSGGQNSRGGI